MDVRIQPFELMELRGKADRALPEFQSPDD